MSLSKKKLGLALALLALAPSSVHRTKCKRRWWVKKRLTERPKSKDVALLRTLEPEDFRNCLRMTEEIFSELLMLVAPAIQKQNTRMRNSITPEERLVTTLRFLATGCSYADLKFSAAVSAQSIGQMIPETCAAIRIALKDYVKLPSTPEQWLAVAKDFEGDYGFSHCLGVVDGKHVSIKKPTDSGTMYYNYKGYYSIVLMAVVNAKYQFMYVNTGVNGSACDSSVFQATQFYKKLSEGTLNIPAPEPLPDSSTGYAVPYVFLGDSAFAISENVMEPYSTSSAVRDRGKRMFNYRLSRGRQVVENAFGILAMRFGVLLTTIAIRDLDSVGDIVSACTALHNFLLAKNPGYISPGDVDYQDTSGSVIRGSWRDTGSMAAFVEPGRINNVHADNLIRKEFARYFMHEGRVEFQDRMADHQ